MGFYVDLLLANWQKALYGGIIVVSAVIVIMGILKVAFNKINNKLLRKFLLSFSSVVLVLPVTAIYFAGAGINFDYYWVGYGLCAFATIIVYWLYENTCLRDLIHKIGSLSIAKFTSYAANRITGNGNVGNDLSALKDVTNELEGEVKGIVADVVNPHPETSTIRIPLNNATTVAPKRTKSFEKETEELKKL